MVHSGAEQFRRWQHRILPAGSAQESVSADGRTRCPGVARGYNAKSSDAETDPVGTSAAHFPNLFSPFTIRGVTLRNRIMSTGHETGIVDATGINDALVAYHRARAAGGAGLIVIEVASVHSSATFVRNSIKLYRDEAIPGYRRLADAAHENGAVLFAQLFHPGREILESIDGSAPPSWAPSAVPNERFHVMPAPMPRSLVHEVISGYGDAAYRLQRAGVDGCEILCSMGYLLAQFLNPRVNLRTDEYGGSDENRLRIVREILHDIRAKVGDEMVVGIRISGDELSPEGLGAEEVLSICAALDDEAGLDYFNVIAGTSTTLGGSVHIVPPMTVGNAYLAPYAAAVKARVTKPVFVGGRINQPQQAEAIVASGQADVCGMTRAMICDPEMPNKATEGRKARTSVPASRATRRASGTFTLAIRCPASSTRRPGASSHSAPSLPPRRLDGCWWREAVPAASRRPRCSRSVVMK